MNLSGIPGGISLFHLAVWNPNAADDNRTLYCIDLKREFKQNLSDAEFKELSSQTVYVPQSYREMMKAMEFQLNIFQIILGEESYLASEYKLFLDGLKSIDREIEECVFASEEFPAKFFLRVDCIIGRFINSVYSAPSMRQVKWRVLGEFDSLLAEVEQRRFWGADLPEWILKVRNPNSAAGGNGTKTPGKGKGGKDDMKDFNTNVADRIKVTNEEYKTKIAGIPGDKRPNVCLRYATRGWCFKDSTSCRLHHTHKKLSKAAEKEVFDFLVKQGLKKNEE